MQCCTSISKMSGLMCTVVLMLGLSWFCTTIPGLKAQIAGWFGLVFFGFGFLLIAAQLFRTDPLVVLDESGIHDVRSSCGEIPWSDVESLWIGEVKSQRFLCVEVWESETYLSRMPSHKRLLAEANHSLGFPPVTISWSGLSPGLDEVWSYVQTNHPEKTSGTEDRRPLNDVQPGDNQRS